VVLELGMDLAQASTILVERLVVLDLVQVLDGLITIGPLDVLDLDMAVHELVNVLLELYEMLELEEVWVDCFFWL
jgi:hypothetical protein